MSWIWGNETQDQAQIVVSALQSELDQREDKIKALETSLRREQNELEQLLQGEIRELEARRTRIQAELDEIETLIGEKQDLLQHAVAARKKKPRKSKSVKKSASEGEVSAAAEANGKVEANGKAAGSGSGSGSGSASAPGSPRPSKDSNANAKATPKAKEAKAEAKSEASTETTTEETKQPKGLPMGTELAKVAQVDPNVAFIIQRSNNSNTVVYAGRLDSAGKQLDKDKPMDVYWIMYEKKGNPREELTLLERSSAYGIAIAPSAIADQYIVALSSLKDRECLLFIDDNGTIQARTVIDSKPNMILRRVFVQATTSWGMPVVDYVEIFGMDPKTHADVYEKKFHKK